jgi:hypothetical protein
MQVVFLSARPAVLAGTLRFFAAHLPFVDDVLVVTPERLRAEVSALGVAVVTDEELLGDAAGLVDHARRNYALRAALATCDAVQEVFLGADDDNRPLVPLPETTFFRDGRYRRYSFGWLDDWENRSTSFDASQLATRQVLALHGLPRRAYGSHMPQVVDKDLLVEAVALLAVAADRHPVCEWSGYLNVAGGLHPDRFEEPEPYLTLGWPDDSATWQATLDPGALAFENFFAEHYAPGQVFAGLDPDDLSYEAAVDKVVRWRRYELEVLDGERPAALAPVVEPGAVGAALRRARAKAVGDPTLKDRRQRASVAAALRAQRRP